MTLCVLEKLEVVRRKKKMPCGITSLTDDILLDILTRLPAKVVGQCKCICKHWRSLIEDPSFVELHHFHANSRPGSSHLVISLCTEDFKEMHFFSADYEGGPAHHLFAYSMSGLYHIKQSVNGLICGFFRLLDSIFVVNPTTKEFVTLPRSGIKVDKSYRCSRRLHAFGYDPSTKQYKVLEICPYPVLQESAHENLKEFYRYECEIFTLGTHSWRKIDVLPSLSCREFGGGGVCIDGVVYWRNTSYYMKPSTNSSGEVIVAFDLKDEKFRVIPLPTGPSCMPRLLELRGHLVACEEYPEPDTQELWILEDYDNWIWVKEIIAPPVEWAREDGPYTVDSIETGEILLHAPPPSWYPFMTIYYYDRGNKSFRRTQITGLPWNFGKLKITNCVENLFSLRDI